MSFTHSAQTVQPRGNNFFNVAMLSRFLFHLTSAGRIHFNLTFSIYFPHSFKSVTFSVIIFNHFARSRRTCRCSTGPSTFGQKGLFGAAVLGFPISDGKAGSAQAEANKVFVDPFKGRDLATVTSAELKAVQTMREAAEAAEVDKFNKQITATSGDAATALQNGKIKNKVLKLTGEVQAIQIKVCSLISRSIGRATDWKRQDCTRQAAGKDTSSDEAKLKEEQTKLTKNIATDVKNKGQASKGVA
ncbi:hypothetical protein RhiXN_10792 [Rhizoctonia solani]|uniref:Small secreted protein n=1 Tax=Rhizoctonia solani TaxID=456999 RepID=A0A8H8P5T7_9AGAM|nr:uncharacterized protein RhiXN_10792 [Rhizoctonia solani]QRW25715.1 hypothetical protein RhiXN_10792 [Rhizoctonia solani]